MITSMSRCVTCDDLWPWLISSRSLGLDFENHVCSVASTVLDGFFLHFAQMITIIRGCATCYVFSESGNLNFWQIFLNFSALTLKMKSTVLDGFLPYLAQMITSMRGCVAPLTVTYIFKVIRPWLWKSCPLCNVFSSWSIISIFAKNNHYH